MRIDSKKYGGVCACGRERQMAAALCAVEAGPPSEKPGGV